MNLHYPHRIRLRGPWQYEALCGAASRGRLFLPAPLCQSPLADHAGPVRFMRRFGYPGQIDSDERVWLLFDGLTSPAALTLNGADLGTATDRAEFDITSRLLSRNELTVDLTVSPGQAIPWNEVWLEVRRTAYLRDVHVRIEGQSVQAAGLVVGHAEAPLDLYLLADGSSVAYISLTPLESGQPFQVGGPVSAVPVAEVRVELVHGGVVWYADRHAFAQGSGE